MAKVGRPTKIQRIIEREFYAGVKYAVYQLDANTGRILKEYRSIYEASQRTGINKGSISKACKRFGYTAGGYGWEYVL